MDGRFMAIKKLRTGVLAGCGLVAAVLSGQTAHAATIYSTGFGTTEGFTNGQLVGQTGGTPPRTFASTPTPTPTSLSAAVSNGTAVITATNLSSNNSAGGGDIAVYYPGIPLGSVTPNSSGQNIITVSTDLSITAAAGTFPGFGYEVFGSSGSGTENSIFSLFELGDNTIDLASSSGVSNPGAAGQYAGTHTFATTLNYTTGGYSVAVDGTAGVYTGSFDAALGFGGVGIAGATFDSTPGASGTGTFDNFSVTSVPEPTTASLVVGGLAAAGLRRRRRTAR